MVGRWKTSRTPKIPRLKEKTFWGDFQRLFFLSWESKLSTQLILQDFFFPIVFPMVILGWENTPSFVSKPHDEVSIAGVKWCGVTFLWPSCVKSPQYLIKSTQLWVRACEIATNPDHPVNAVEIKSIKLFDGLNHSSVIKLFHELNDTVCHQKSVPKNPPWNRKTLQTSDFHFRHQMLPGVPWQSEDGEDDDANGHAALGPLAMLFMEIFPKIKASCVWSSRISPWYTYTLRNPSQTASVGDLLSTLRFLILVRLMFYHPQKTSDYSLKDLVTFVSLRSTSNTKPASLLKRQKTTSSIIHHFREYPTVPPSPSVPSGLLFWWRTSNSFSQTPGKFVYIPSKVM